ncbi:MAG: YdcF family protein [Porticoccaceae bacterium]
MRSFLVFCCTLLFCLWGVVVLGRSFLVVSETPVPADVVVQFVGPDNIARRNTAIGLLEQGLAPLLMVPGTYSLFKRNQQGMPEQLRTPAADDAFQCRLWDNAIRSKVMENTHKELVLAKCAMDRLHLRSAILVSSPCHMRRIRLIADRVFGNKRYHITCVAAATGQPPSLSWWPDRGQWWWLVREYPKILWFFVYELFFRLAMP